MPAKTAPVDGPAVAARPTRPDVSVVIVSYNTAAMTLRCLETLRPQLEGLGWEVWVVDNGSSDGSCAAIREAAPWVRLIASGENLGFGRANNRAMHRAGGRYLLLLNSDAFVKPGTVRALVSAADARPEVGVLAPRLLNADGSLQRSCWRFPSPGRSWLEALAVPAWPIVGRLAAVDDYRRWGHDSEREVDFAIGACLLVRREVYQSLGGFDPAFFLYGEEADWIRRIADAGWSIRFTPEAEVVHVGGGSGAPQAEFVREQFFAGQERFVRKHYGRLGLLIMRMGVAVNNALRLPVWCVGGLLGVGRLRPRASLSWWLLMRQFRYGVFLDHGGPTTR